MGFIVGFFSGSTDEEESSSSSSSSSSCLTRFAGAGDEGSSSALRFPSVDIVSKLEHFPGESVPIRDPRGTYYDLQCLTLWDTS